MVPPIGPVYSVSQTRPTPITGSAGPTSSKSSSSLAHANFWDTYEHMCALQNEMPLQILKASLAVDAGSNLVINSDRLKFEYLIIITNLIFYFFKYILNVLNYLILKDRRIGIRCLPL
jgi:hypothetical protein